MNQRKKYLWNRKRKIGELLPKLIRVVLAIVIVAFFSIAVMMIVYYSTNYKNQIVRNEEQQLERTVSQISFLQSTITNIAKQLVVDDELQVRVREKKESSSAYLINKRRTRTTLTSYAHCLDAIQEILIYTKDEQTYSSTEVREDFHSNEVDWYEEFKKTGRKSGYSIVHPSVAPQGLQVIDVLTYILTYSSVDTSRSEIGDLMISVDYSAWKQIASLDMSMLDGYCLYDGVGNTILSDGQISLSKEEIRVSDQKQLIGQNGNRILVSKSMEDGWIFAIEISEKQIQKQIGIVVTGLFIATVLVVFVLYWVLTHFIIKIVKPVNQLSEAAEKVGNGNFDVAVDIHTNDELEILANVFNQMVQDIQKLMNESVEHEKLARKMQIDQLMLQINPHFIYNTLNSIVYMARMEGNTSIAEFANAFVSLLQSTLRINDSIYITIGEELQNLDYYLKLQKYRYEDKFDVFMECPEDLKACQIPNVMLQPIVENAIFHGIAPKEEKGYLQIVIQKLDHDIQIVVEDDGVGMSEEMIERLLSGEQVSTGGLRKIGIANVSKRIKEIFGENYSLEIYSFEGEGTQVMMTIPYIVKEDKGE